MTDGFRIAPMRLDDLRIAADWAAAEGWNPGIEDAETFYGVDPEGFLMGWVDDEPVSAISVVRHNTGFGFLGFYLCRPDQRGKGYGFATWTAGIARLGHRTIGLDGVPAQTENYRRSGFVEAHLTQRYAGEIQGRPHQNCRPARAMDLSDLLALDTEASGTDRSGYAERWFQHTATRRTVVYEDHGQTVGAATIRRCRDGHKIGPVLASHPETACALVEAAVHEVSADFIMIDIPDPNDHARDLAVSWSIEPVFACTRMYRGDAPPRALDRIYGEMTFELG